MLLKSILPLHSLTDANVDFEVLEKGISTLIEKILILTVLSRHVKQRIARRDEMDLKRGFSCTLMWIILPAKCNKHSFFKIFLNKSKILFKLYLISVLSKFSKLIFHHGNGLKFFKATNQRFHC